MGHKQPCKIDNSSIPDHFSQDTQAIPVGSGQGSSAGRLWLSQRLVKRKQLRRQKKLEAARPCVDRFLSFLIRKKWARWLKPPFFSGETLTHMVTWWSFYLFDSLQNHHSFINLFLILWIFCWWNSHLYLAKSPSLAGYIIIYPQCYLVRGHINKKITANLPKNPQQILR